MADLYEKVNMLGKPIALANVTQDDVRKCYILFGKSKATICADVIEFTE